MSRMRRAVGRPVVAAVLVSHIVFILVAALRAAGALEEFELTAYDYYLRWSTSDSIPRDSVVVIGINEEDIRTWRWPISDTILSEVLDGLAPMGPLAIGIDIYRDAAIPPGADYFSTRLTTYDTVIGISKFADETTAGVPPPRALRGTDRIGFNDVTDDPDGIIRRGLLFLDDGEQFMYSFALRLALKYLEAHDIRPQADNVHPDYLRLGAQTIPPLAGNAGGYIGADDKGYQFLLDYAGGLAPPHMVSLTEFMLGEVPAEAIRGKMVLIGAAADSINDYFYTPLSAESVSRRRTFGVVLHALIADQLVRLALGESRLREGISESREYLWIWLWCLVPTLLACKLRHALAYVALVAACITGLGLATFWAFAGGLWIPIAPPVVGMLTGTSLLGFWLSSNEKSERMTLMQLFARQVSPAIADLIWERRAEMLQDGHIKPQRVFATTLFSDIKDFTSVSERMDPEELMTWLNSYMDSMAKIVQEHGGVVDKFIGDAVMAVFGVPVPSTTEDARARDAFNAVTCALAMRRELFRLGRVWVRQGLPVVGLRIGIYSGPLVTGSVGSAERSNFTIIGDSVNVAARLESFGKEANNPDEICRIMIGDSTYGYVCDAFETEQIGEVLLKGKDKPVIVHRVVAAAS
jgi:adenylate cyclase